MKHQIHNLHAHPVKGSATFDYRGYTISLSTVFDSGDTVGVWKGQGYNAGANPDAGFVSVAEAIEWVRAEDMGDNP